MTKKISDLPAATIPLGGTELLEMVQSGVNVKLPVSSLPSTTFTGGTLTSALNEAPLVTIASAGTVNIGAAAANTINISGSTAITSLGTIAAGAERVLIFGGILTFTHNATSLILPTAANITTAAGDVAWVISLGSGNWKCLGYWRANGQPLAGGGGGGGLTYLTEAKNTSSPNATIPVVSLTVTVTETNGDVAWVPKGTGGFALAVANSSASGGDKRGTYSVDLQLSRTSSSQVASGSYSAVLGGQNNTATGQWSATVGGLTNQANNSAAAVLGGNNNVAGAQYSAIAGGVSNTANGNYSFVGGGTSNNISGNYGACLGGNANVVSGIYAGCLAGQNNTVSGDFASIAGGSYGTTRGVVGMEARASGRFSTAGDAQRERLPVRRATTDATPTPLTSDASSQGTTNQIVLPDNSCFVFRALVVGRANASGDGAGWEVKGVAKRGSGAATVTLVGTPTVTSLGADSGASSWTVAPVADTSFGCLRMQVTGATSTSIKWFGDIETAEVVG